MKLSLSSDYGTPEHWGRIIEFAREYEVDRLVYWGDSCTGRNKFSGFTPPFLYPKYPELNQQIKKSFKSAICKIRDYFRTAYEMTLESNIEFWYVFQALQFPDIGFDAESSLKNVDLEPIRKIYPDLVNDAGEIDMSCDFIYEFINDQIDELFELAPGLSGLELWIMERSTIKIARLKSQRVSTDEIIERIVKTVRGNLQKRGRKLDVDLHTAGGEIKTLRSLMNAARKYGDVFISADNTIGDYHLHLPFNEHLREASKTNKVIVNFDLNGEYWGRNFVPTTAINQYEKHIEEARKINAEYINGRVATENDMSNPHSNALPSRKKDYPKIAGDVLDMDLRIPSIDTLGAFNAIYFCLKAKDPETRKEEVIERFLKEEFGFPADGTEAKRMTNIFLKLESVLKKIFYMDKNLYHGQSLLCQPVFVPVYAIDVHLTSPQGTLFPTEEALQVTNDSVHPVAFEGWPVPRGHAAFGPKKIIAEKEKAVLDSKAMLRDVLEITSPLEKEKRDYINGMFGDLHLLSEAFLLLTQAHVHYFLFKKGRRIDDLPNIESLKKTLLGMDALADKWTQKYPNGRYSVSETLAKWRDIISRDLP